MKELSLTNWLKQPATDDELQAVFSAVAQEQSPRAAALGAAAMLDVALSHMLKARLWIKDQKADSELFGMGGPMSSFSQRIKMAEAMRIIGPVTRSNLDHIREIRNAFAHTHRPLTFNTPGVTAICDRLTIPVWPRRPRKPIIATARDKYVYGSLGLFVIFEEVARHTRSGDSGDYSNWRIPDWWGERFPAPLP